MTTSRLTGDWSAMRGRDEGPEPGGRAVPWTRGAIVSLWLITFALAAGTLAVRWDALMASLAGPPSVHGGAAQR